MTKFNQLKKRFGRTFTVSMATMAGGLFVLGCIGCTPNAMNAIWDMTHECNFQESKFNAALDSLRTGALKADAAGRVTLSPYLRPLTDDGHLYVTRSGDLSLVLFPSRLSHGRQVDGYLHCNRALTPADTDSAAQSVVGSVMSIIGPGAFNPRRINIVVDSQLARNWYCVSTHRGG